MRFLFRKKERSEIEFAFIYGGLAILLLTVARILPVIELAPDCAFRSLTGIPCPTCGSTRSIVFLSQGYFISAFRMNPVTSAVFVTVLLAFLYRMIALTFDLPAVSISLTDREKNLFRVSAVLALLLNWAYLIRAL